MSKSKSKTVNPIAKPNVPAAVAAAATAPSMPDIYASTLALALDRSTFGNKRKVSMGAVDVRVADAEENGHATDQAADKNMLTLSKKLLNSTELKAINGLDGEVVRYLNTVCVPSFFKPGIHLVPLPLVDQVDAKLVEFAAKRTALVEEFVAVYPSAVASMAAVLRELFNPLEYPDAEEVRRYFGFSWRYLNLGTPSQLQTLSKKVFDQQKAAIQAQINDAAIEIRSMLRATMAELVKHMHERLTPGVDGKNKRFHESTIQNLNTFLDNFDLRNVTNDTELQALVKQAKNLVNGVDQKMLQSDEAIRAAVATGIDQLKTKLDAMVVSGRAINLDDEGPVGVLSPAKKAAMTKARSKVA